MREYYNRKDNRFLDRQEGSMSLMVFLYLLEIVQKYFLRIENKVGLRQERNRESKTTKLEEEANKKLVEAESLSGEYNKKLHDLAAEVYKTVQVQKQEIDEKEKENLKKAEDQINLEVDKQRKTIREEVEMKREGVFQNKESLSTTLVDKLIN